MAKDWSTPNADDSIDVPDELYPLFNKIGFQFKFVQYSGKNEVLAIAHIVQGAQEFFSQNPHLLLPLDKTPTELPTNNEFAKQSAGQPSNP